MTDKEKLNAIVDYLKRSQDGIFESICELSNEQSDSDYSIDLNAKHNVLSSVIVEVLRIIDKENEKGIAEYGQSLSRSTLSVKELLGYELDELVDSVQYNRVAKQRTIQAVALLKQNPPDVAGAIRLLEG
ncbi:hypothetical protein GTN30_06365 [Macrococcoides canis]|uniref:Uncharacterized protein n=1 Tax=Macrococcoides canis TaxID=1855823 RepID=A0AAE6X0P2_9STAP|nr:hypothetical protein [Macrococcus canis]QIH78291.1 hypothetical protein GTN30_06365 [Macrococcus canis]